MSNKDFVVRVTPHQPEELQIEMGKSLEAFRAAFMQYHDDYIDIGPISHALKNWGFVIRFDKPLVWTDHKAKLRWRITISDTSGVTVAVELNVLHPMWPMFLFRVLTDDQGRYICTHVPAERLRYGR